MWRGGKKREDRSRLNATRGAQMMISDLSVATLGVYYVLRKGRRGGVGEPKKGREDVASDSRFDLTRFRFSQLLCKCDISQEFGFIKEIPEVILPHVSTCNFFSFLFFQKCSFSLPQTWNRIFDGKLSSLRASYGFQLHQRKDFL